MKEYLDSYKGIDSMIEFPVPKFMCNNRNYLILIATLKSTTKKKQVNSVHACQCFMKQNNLKVVTKMLEG
jgi:hypothetical protein